MGGFALLSRFAVGSGNWFSSLVGGASVEELTELPGCLTMPKLLFRSVLTVVRGGYVVARTATSYEVAGSMRWCFLQRH